MDARQLSPEVRADIARMDKERAKACRGLDPAKWGARMGPRIKGMQGQTEDYQRQELIVEFVPRCSGFWELVNHLAELESKTLSIQCTVDTILLCTIVRCDAGGREDTKSVTMQMGGTGSVQVWTLSWEEKAGKKVYTLRPVAPIARQAAAAKEEGGAFNSTPRADMDAMRGLLAEMGALRERGDLRWG
jgi:hypothetical protein